MPPQRWKTRILCCLFGSLLAAGRAAETDLARDFQNPPFSAKPKTWWHWISGNVSSEGIAADLQAMQQIGLAGAQIFTVEASAVKGPVKFMSPEWRSLIHQAMTQADRLHLQLGVEDCEGWNESGGPWIQPAQSMQQIVWTEQRIEGGRTVPLALPQPETKCGYYEDIALLAFPEPSGDDLPAPVQVTGSVPGFDGRSVYGDNLAPALPVSPKNPASPWWIQLNYDHAITCRSLWLRFDVTHAQNTGQFAHALGELETSDDGVTFRAAGAIVLDGLSAFPAATGKSFRLRFAQVPAVPLLLTRISLQGPRTDSWAQRVGTQSVPAVSFTAPSLAATELLNPGAVLNLTGNTAWEAPPGKWVIIRLGHTSTGKTTGPASTPGLECDKLSRAAVQFHAEHMYGPLLQDSSALAGKSFHEVLIDSWEAGSGNWTARMPEEFRRRRGYDLQAWLPALTGRVMISPELTERFLWDYRRTLADLLAENHYGTFQAFAHQNHLEFDSEATGIHLPTVADQLQCKGRTDLPMGEFWLGRLQKQSSLDDTKEAASAAHIYGQNIAAAEAYTAQPEDAAWTNDPQSLKAQGDLEFCLGINRFMFHRYAHQPWLDRRPGMSLGPYGINFERTNTWWTQGAAWISYLARCQFLLQQGRFVADLLYFYGEGAPVGVRLDKLQPAVPVGFDYDVCDAEILLNRTAVDEGRIRLSSGISYRVLVLPETDRMSLPLLRKIESLVRGGATVYGPKPTHSPSLAGYPHDERELQRIADQVWGNCDGATVRAHFYGKGKVMLGVPLARALAIPPDFQVAEPDLPYIHREDHGTQIYFVSNQQAVARTVTCQFRIAGLVPELWHPESGRRETAALFRTTGGQTSLPIHFEPLGSVFVVFRHPAGGSQPLIAVKRNDAPLFRNADEPLADLPEARGDFIAMTAWQSGRYTFAGAGAPASAAEVAALPEPIVVRGPWLVTFPPREGAPASAVFDRLISWPEDSDAGVRYFSGTATYQRNVNIPPEYFGPHRRVYLDLGVVKNLAAVSVNGKALATLWKTPFRIELTGCLRPGINHLAIAVTNLWPNRLIGDQRLPPAERSTWSSVSLYPADAPLLESGLIGPVAIVAAEEVIVRRPAPLAAPGERVVPSALDR